ncbi:MAG: 2-C-methyl-D-erythritol 4-phosphate cytidylyltransferase [Sedimenticola sp.]|nr:2-C-methyl-D-erythritol 4-phosphate cytidylyltransferase [Sedimenticola sp.]
MNQHVRYWSVVPAAGVGRRMESELPKQYLPLHGRSLIEHALLRLLEHPLIERVVVALADSDPWWETLEVAASSSVIRTPGGAERAESVLNGLRALAGLAAPEDWVLVHDAARPCLQREDLDRLISTLADHPVGGLLGVPLHDTVKRAERTGTVIETLPREQLWRAFTPQMFRYGQLLQALQEGWRKRRVITDEASAMEQAGHRPLLVEGRSDNIKVTRREDLALAAFYLDQIGGP